MYFSLLVEEVCRGLGSGERSAILLAKSLPADLTLLDEWKARRIAQQNKRALLSLAVLGYSRPAPDVALSAICARLTWTCFGKGFDSISAFFRTAWCALDCLSCK